MANLTIHTKRIIENIEKMTQYLQQYNIEWTLVTKMLCGYEPVLEQIMTSQCMSQLHSVGDSRISNLRIIKNINPQITTMYVKPPALIQANNVVRYADISLNTTSQTIEALNEAAEKQNKIHKVIVMIELGELREGIMREKIIKFYEKIFNLPHIKIIGLGTNLGCMYGIEPTYDKLIQLALYSQVIEMKFSQKLEVISGGSSITLPLITRKKLPNEVRHFRIGETIFLGISLANNKRFRNLSTSVFDFSADILEVEKKNSVPDGVTSNANVGHAVTTQEDAETYRCIVDFGQLDVDVAGLQAKDPNVNFAGTTSDMTVFDVGNNSNKYKVGKQIHFSPNYMAIARLMNSRYVTKNILFSKEKSEIENLSEKELDTSSLPELEITQSDTTVPLEPVVKLDVAENL